MNLVGFNATVAREHGYKIVRYANGDEQSVPVNPHSHLPKSPILTKHARITLANQDYDSVKGNCGSAWIAVVQTGSSHVSISSGFHVSSPAWYWDWKVVAANAYVGNKTLTAGGVMASESASRVWQNIYQPHATFDYVSYGVAFMDDGETCHAGRPNVSIGL